MGHYFYSPWGGLFLCTLYSFRNASTFWPDWKVLSSSILSTVSNLAQGKMHRVEKSGIRLEQRAQGAKLKRKRI